MRTEYLEYLIEVADSGSMSKAAKKLFLTQPAVSNAINALEEEIGWPILERTVNGVAPTTKGKLVVDDAKLIVSMIRDWNNLVECKAAVDEIVGDVYVGDSGEVGLTYFQDIVAEVNKCYPKLVVHFVNPHNTLQQLNNGRFQIAILPIVPEHHTAIDYYLEHYRWKQQKLYTQEYQLLVNPDSPLASKEKIRLMDLTGHTIVLHPQFPYRFVLNPVAGTSHIIYDEAIKLVTAVSLNEAVGLFPPTRDNLAMAFARAGLLKYCTISDVSMPLEFNLIYSEYFSRTPAGKLIISLIQEKFKNSGDFLNRGI